MNIFVIFDVEQSSSSSSVSFYGFIFCPKSKKNVCKIKMYLTKWLLKNANEYKHFIKLIAIEQILFGVNIFFVLAV